MFLRRIRNRRRVDPITDETISIRAYELWQARGCPDNSGDQDWQTAKEQLAFEADQSSRRRPLRNFFARLRNRAAL